MKFPDNLALFNFCLKNPEPCIEESYIKEGTLVISETMEKETELMKNNSELIDNISMYSIGHKKHDKHIEDEALSNILALVENDGMNFSEFVSFWPVADISYSIFQKLDAKTKKEILKIVTEKYIELRHNLYKLHGYSPVTLQVGKDAKAHKENGPLGIKKVRGILNSIGFKQADTENPALFLHDGNKKYIETDKKGKVLFKQLIDIYELEFSWRKIHENKMPDFLVRLNDDIFIIEHKHVKENGGGQDKQVSEVISFIGYQEKDKRVHYMSFIDGIYFNQFVEGKSDSKLASQFDSIKDNLTLNKQNYFVNTAGFKEFFRLALS